MWSKDRFSMVSTTMWSMFDSVPGEKSQAGLGLVGVGQSAGVSKANTFCGPVKEMTRLSSSTSTELITMLLWSASCASSATPPTSQDVAIELMPSIGVRPVSASFLVSVWNILSRAN